MENVAEIVQSLISEIGTQTFVGDFPSLSTEGISIKLSEGEDVQRYLGMSTVILRPYVLIVAKCNSYNDGENWLQAIRVILDTYKSKEILAILLSTPPLYLGRDEQKLHQFQITYKIMIKE